MVISNTANLIIIGGVILFFISFGVLGIILYRKYVQNRSVRLNFISGGGHVESTRVRKKDILETVSYDGGTYTYDSSCEVTTFRGKEIFYFKGSTPPLKMDFKNKKIKDNTKINSENLKAIMETELIAKLFKKDVVSLDALLILVGIIIGCVALFMVITMKYGGVNLADSPENVLIMKDLIKQALASGI